MQVSKKMRAEKLESAGRAGERRGQPDVIPAGTAIGKAHKPTGKWSRKAIWIFLIA
jgi:hypothetical protein